MGVEVPRDQEGAVVLVTVGGAGPGPGPPEKVAGAAVAAVYHHRLDDPQLCPHHAAAGFFDHNSGKMNVPRLLPIREITKHCLHWAVNSGDTKLVRTLLDPPMCCDIDAVYEDPMHATPLMLAVQRGDKEMVVKNLNSFFFVDVDVFPFPPNKFEVF